MNHSAHTKILETTIENISAHYSALTPSCIQEFLAASRLFSVEKNTILVTEGEQADKMYFLIEGCLRVYYHKEEKDISDWFAFDNDFVCSITSFFKSVPSPHYVQTLEATRYLEISREDVFKLMERHHSFETLSRKVVTEIMLQQQNRMVSIQFETAQQKYESLLRIRKDITQRVPLTHIASFLGITLETLSRIRNPKKRI